MLGKHRTHHRVRVAVVVASATLLFALIAGAFWHEDLRYSRPTPRPAGLVQPPRGARLPVRDWLASAGLDARGRPVHLHFFNPACPCSRFNVDHLRELVRRFGDRVFFAAVIQSELTETPAGRRELADRMDGLALPLPWIADPGGRIATAAGVYSTPQAVITAADGALHYRGNYNLSRYCNDPRTQFARLALEALLRDAPAAPAALAAVPELPAYGCTLPSRSAR